jgi:sugar/nucleoside kinase (ribokinase family)
MPTKTVDVIAAGHICLDMFPRFMNEPGMKVADLLRAGTLVKVGDMAFGTGGSVSNTGFALRIFGCKVAYVAKIGDDVIGSIIADIVRKNGQAGGLRVSPGEPSSYSVVLAPVGVDRIFLHCPGTNDTFTRRDIDFDLVARARLFHLGYPTLMDALFAHDGKELIAIYRRAKSLGVTTSMDISLPDPKSPAGQANWRGIFERVLPHTDIFTPSIEEAFFMLDPAGYLARRAAHPGEQLIEHVTPDEFRALADRFLALGCAVVALKAGYNGWYLRTGCAKRLAKMGRAMPRPGAEWADRELWCPAFDIERIASSTGAGDVSIAAFLTGLMRGLSPEGCLRMANCAGYTNLRTYDALSGLVSWEEMERMLPTLVACDVPPLHGTDWRWDKPAGLWRRGKDSHADSRG